MTGGHHVLPQPTTSRNGGILVGAHSSPGHAVSWTSIYTCLTAFPRTPRLSPAPPQAQGKPGRSQVENLRLVLVG